MFSRLREPFGKAGLIVAVVALVASLVGGAYAAQSATDSAKRNHKAKRNKKKKQKGVTVAQVRKIAKQEARKYANSNPGPAGPQGPAGADGANGNDGQNGSNGSNGSNGKDGASVVMTSEAPFVGDCGDQGGAGFTVDGGPKVTACNGEEGPEGPKGDPWTAGGTLPVGSTETGAWAIFFEASEAGRTAISFTVPLATSLEGDHAVVVASGETPPATCDDGLPGNGAPGPTNPEADSGYLCVFVAPGVNGPPIALKPGVAFEFGAGKTGAILAGSGAATSYTQGTFAVTG